MSGYQLNDIARRSVGDLADRPLVSDQPLRCRHFAEMIAYRAAEQQNQVALVHVDYGRLVAVDKPLTYGDLDRRARQIATVLASHTSPGSRALLLYHAGLDYICAFMACLYAGVIAVPAYPALNPRLRMRLERVAQDCNATVILTTSDLTKDREQAGSSLLDTLHWIETDTDLSGLEHVWRMRDIQSDDCAFLQYTSGSSGTPKGVMVSHGNLLNNARVTSQHLKFNTTDSYFSWLPPYHDMGLIGAILTSLGAGVRLDFMAPTAFLRSPVRWLREMSKRKSTISGAPNFAFEMCLHKIPDSELDDIDLSNWTLAYSGAEIVQQDTLRRFAERFGRYGFDSRALVPCYGLAEATLVMSGGQRYQDFIAVRTQEDSYGKQGKVIEAKEDEPSKVIVSCGTMVDDHVSVIVDPQTLQPLADNTVGEILISGPSIAAGYWNRPDDSAATFACRVSGYEHEFMRTGDLGFTRNGELFICGRLKDLIIIRGKNHYPHDIEASIEQAHAAIRPGCGIAFSIELEQEERLIFVQEIARRDAVDKADEIFAAMHQVLVEEHQLQPYAMVLIESGTIPRTTSRKLSRRPCRDNYLRDELAVLNRWVNPIVQTSLSKLINNGAVQILGEVPNAALDTEALEHAFIPAIESQHAHLS